MNALWIVFGLNLIVIHPVGIVLNIEQAEERSRIVDQSEDDNED